MDSCIFCKIGKGEISSFKVWEDDSNIAFLDIRPIKRGHTIVVPKKHFSYLFDMPDQDYTSLMQAVKKVSRIIKSSMQPKSGKVGVVVYGLDVDHVHVHLVPIDKSGDLSFSNAKPATNEELKQTLDNVKAAI